MTDRTYTQEEAEDMRAALVECQRLFEEALPKFDWGKSHLDGNAILLLNNVPIQVGKVLVRTA